MKKITILVGLILALSLGSNLYAQRTADETLFREAKLLVYDKDWKAALDKIDELREDYPDSPYAGQALFYKGECLKGLGGREREALRAFKDYVKSTEAKANLVEEAEGRIVDLAFELYDGGDGGALRDVESRLEHKNMVVRYYAAYKLSLVKDKRVAAKAAPVLQKIIETEKDPELLDRARIALLRVSPESLKSAEESLEARHPRTGSSSPRMLRIRVYDKGRKEAAFALNIPWALADLALGAMDDDDKAELRKKGYDLNKIMSELAKSKESILKITGDDGSVIEIWID
jgi:hypothetical protein